MNSNYPECTSRGGIFAYIEGKVEGAETLDDASLLV
jgi:hypothetical protein